MKKIKLIRFISFLLVFAILYGFMSEFFTVNGQKDSMHLHGFYLEPKNSLDVALIGPSEFYTGFSSALAWEKYGFTSYALTYGGIPVTLYKSMLKDVLKRQSPKLIVFEINAIIKNDEYLKKESRNRKWIDNMPFSKNKLDTIKEVIPKDERYSYYLRLFKYHSNWKNIGFCFETFVGKAKMSLTGYSYTKSLSTTTGKRKVDDCKKYKVEFTKLGEKALRELLQFCKDQGLKNVLFVRFPHCTTAKNPEVLEKINSVIHEYGYDTVSFENSYEEIGLDKKNNFYNAEHMNAYGMEKFTSYFGKYICDNYDVKTEHSAELVDQWNICAEKTNKILKRAKKDIDNGKRRTYFEMSAYDKKNN